MIKVRGFRVVVKPDPVTKETEAGIIVSTDEKLEKTGIQRGVLVAIGADAWKAYRKIDENGKEVNGEQWANVGDYVLFSRHAGRFVYDPFEDDERNEYMIMNDDDILAVLVEGENEVPENSAKAKARKMLV